MSGANAAIVYIKFKTDVVEISVGEEGGATAKTVGWLKRRLCDHTQVSPEKQKLLGLKARGGGKVTDDTPIVDLDLSTNSAKKPAMLLGTPDAAHDRLRAEVEAQPQNQDPEDEEEGAGEQSTTIDLAERPDIVAKLETRFRRANIVQLNEPRRTKMAVFDIDYTFFDLGGTSERAEELLRPYTKEFMTYLNVELGFDIIIWSANSMKWIMVKLKELGLLGDDVPFKIVAAMDYTAMLTLSTEELAGDDRKRKRRSATFDCKPLQVLWNRYKDFYQPSTTIMFDDLRRNFILNKKQGLVVKPFRKSAGRSDQEFRGLMRYMAMLAGLDSFDGLDHDNWRRHAA